MEPWNSIPVGCVVKLWIATSLNSAVGAGNISVLISMGSDRLALSLIPTILDTITGEKELLGPNGMNQFPTNTFLLKNLSRHLHNARYR